MAACRTRSRAARPAAVIVLAAGEGTRMKSRTSKVLHELCGRSMVGHVLAAARELEPERLVVVVGHRREQVVAHLAEHVPDAEPVVQERQGGTGHAVRTTLEQTGDLRGTVVVTNGDHPLLRGETLAELVATHEADGNAVTVLTTEMPDATGYGRMIRAADGSVSAIVEHKDATAEQRAVNEINVGMYAFDGALLAAALKRVTTDNANGEEYLTDVVAILRGDGHRAGAHRAADWVETQGVNDKVQLAQARRQLNDRILEAHMRAGVTIVDPATTWIDVQVSAEPDAIVHPATQLHGRTHLGEGARVGPGCTLTDTRVGADATVVNAVCVEAEIGPQASVGPYAYLRPGTRLARKAKAGTYVEMKNAQVGEGSKVPHLTYVGDAEIGTGSNIGASSVFVNYDGVTKSRSVIGDHVKVGSDNMIVAPVTVGDGAYTAAGSVIVQDVPPGAMAVARGRQRNIAGWVERKRAGTPAADAARRARDDAAGEHAAGGD
ncbi:MULTISPECIES: bifunctional UDP-N-acetylglucosamine diphosphorylase/glucosamine-1-phosphate N-acetyltransferase GlmU [Thermomonosporaceae]|uniref:bifunctional UDP-N-acetylglucosamine diphosphorylase/glucosamine-1-phosphate N-acetyltransferase GlmU n=1 Tax=Thermomonosporaceae TaxID=2012 RepID=UPI00255B1372|nr:MULTISPECIES: bifunctional UDP-N-acetylglucosamine diphosphorylase/glucosamine-1-phosphate N-acetyltransferase GlmU [Thermomonosporaceae]MDL4772354.1 bifunctional UDP-N-acetylglucosamine diphosphorylase/glucosamine-1-phosphate N-acetyltransferase GlmU [Actinomadura xylanilytica]